MIAVNDWMDSGAQKQRVDICEKTIQEIRTNANIEFFVKTKTLYQILLGVVEELDSHRIFLRISALAASQSLNLAFPSATLC